MSTPLPIFVVAILSECLRALIWDYSKSGVKTQKALPNMHTKWQLLLFTVEGGTKNYKRKHWLCSLGPHGLAGETGEAP